MSGPRPLLTDFGLARWGTGQPGLSPPGSRLTRTGETLGTPAYMSPEQARGDLANLTPASDVWALGALLYELLAGRQAFGGDASAAAIGQVLMARAPRIRRWRPDAPSTLDAVVRATLSRTPARRHASAAALRDDLVRVLGGRRPLLPGRRRAMWGLRALGAGAAAASLAAGLWPRAGDPTPQAARARDPDAMAAALAERAWAQRQTDLVRASALLTEALGAAPARPEWWLRLGLLRWALGDDAGATAAWSAVADGGPDSTRAWWLRGLAAQVRAIHSRDPADDAEADRAWSRAASGEGTEAQWAATGLALRRGEFAVVRAALAANVHWEAAVLTGLAEIDARSRSGDPVAAIRAYTLILSEGVPIAWVFKNRGDLRERQGDAVGAREDYDAAIAMRPDYVRALDSRAALRGNEGDLAGAHADYARALAVKPDDHLILFNRARLRERSGDSAGALMDYDAAIAAAPAAPTPRYNRALLRANRKDLAGARADLDAALELEPASPRVLLSRGLVRMDQGDLEGALQDLQAARRAGGRVSGQALIGIGAAHGRRGDWRAAAAAFREAIDADLEPDQVARARRLLADCERRLASSPSPQPSPHPR